MNCGSCSKELLTAEDLNMFALDATCVDCNVNRTNLILLRKKMQKAVGKEQRKNVFAYMLDPANNESIPDAVKEWAQAQLNNNGLTNKETKLLDKLSNVAGIKELTKKITKNDVDVVEVKESITKWG